MTPKLKFKPHLLLSLLLFGGVICLFTHHRLSDRLIRTTWAGRCLVYGLCTFPSYQKYVRPVPLRPDYVQALYQIMKDVHETFEACHIPYWIEAGTLLGAVRHKGLIPWDDDLDIQVYASSAPQILQKVVPLLERLGYQTYALPEDGGLKVMMTDDQFVRRPHETLPACDIFFAREKKKGLLSIWGSNKTLPLSTLLPLKLYPFGPLRLWGPANPFPYLKGCYGKNWPVMAKRGNDHLTEGRASSHHYFIIQDFAPALPPYPLKKTALEKPSGPLERLIDSDRAP